MSMVEFMQAQQLMKIACQAFAHSKSKHWIGTKVGGMSKLLDKHKNDLSINIDRVSENIDSTINCVRSRRSSSAFSPTASGARN